MKNTINIIFLYFILIFTSCQSEQSRIEQERIEKEQMAEIDSITRKIEIEKEKEEKERIEKERVEKEIYDKFISNSLPTGATPYSKYYGSNSKCNDYGCSKIKVITSNSDVVVTLKKNNKVVRHSYIQAGDNYTFSFPNGTYQAFFYYGKGWNPEKEMKGGEMKGGFISNEDFGKDAPQSLNNNVLTYELILQQNGNFSTSPSNQEEAL